MDKENTNEYAAELQQDLDAENRADQAEMSQEEMSPAEHFGKINELMATILN